MNPSPNCYGGRSTAEPIMLMKAFGESPLLQELLPKATLQLASSLSNDDKEILIYLIGYGCHVMLAMGAPFSVCKLPWKPWKSPSKASRRDQVFRSFSDSCTESSVSPVLAEEVSVKRSSWLLAKHKASSTCDCFSCYSIFWSRWNVSPNRDLINEILDVIEEGPKSSKGKKKKRADKKRAAIGAEACVGKPSGSDVHLEMEHMTQSSGLTQEELMGTQTSNDTSRSLDLIGKACEVMTSTMDGAPHASIMTDEAPKIVTQTLRTGRKKSMFRVTKQKEEACVATLKSPDLRVNKVFGATVIDDEALSVSGLVSDRANGTEVAVAIEVSGNFTTEASEVMTVGISPALLLGKNTPRLHRIGKRRHNQVIPLDCEDVEREQEAAITVESTQAPMSPRVADIGLGGRGFLARVFPDALGRVASRLWDLVSVRLRSRTVEYH